MGTLFTRRAVLKQVPKIGVAMALSGGLLQGAEAVGAAYDNAGLASQSGYATVNPGDKVHISMTPRNTGTTTWSAKNGYGYEARDSWSYWGSHPLWRDVRPGETITFEDTVTAPRSPGTYNFGFLLKHNGANIGPYFFIQVTVRQAGIPISASLPVSSFQTQLGSVTGGKSGVGYDNCGPASVTMAIRSLGGSTDINTAAIAIRGSNTVNNGITGFKWQSTKDFLAQFHLASTDLSTYDSLRSEIAAGHPVIILLNNNKYRYINPAPYSSDDYRWFTTTHIVMVIGYNGSNVYINDPLRTTGNYAVPVGTFGDAASTTPYSNKSSWYAVSVHR